MSQRAIAFALPWLLLASCGGGGGGGAAAPVDPQPPGGESAVHVLLDTSAGNTAFVQSEAISVQLRRADGSFTDNMLLSPRNVALASLSGETEAIELPIVPSGTYTELKIAFAPGTGEVQRDDGVRHSMELTALEISVPFEDSLQHRSTGESWISLRHAQNAPFANIGSHHYWSPVFAGGPSADDSLRGSVVRVVAQDPDGHGFSGTIPGDDHGLVHVRLETESELYDHFGGRHTEHGSWLAGLGAGDEVQVSGTISQDGTVRGRRARHHATSNTPRLIGRITAVNGTARTLEFDVLSTMLHGDRSVLQTPEHTLVTVGNAAIHDSRTHTARTFADLQVNGCIKVEIASRSGNQVIAREIELESRDGAPQFPETEGMVSAVDLAAGTITIVPRHSDPLVVGGQQVTSATAHLASSALLFRKARSGGDRQQITLSSIVVGQDRIWVRGAVTGPALLEAEWVRVRTN